MFIDSFPDSLDLISFFENEPIYQNSDELHYAYTYVDTNGVKIQFSFNAIIGWVQFVLSIQDIVVCKYLTEEVTRFSLTKEKNSQILIADVGSPTATGKMEIILKPFIIAQVTMLTS